MTTTNPATSNQTGRVYNTQSAGTQKSTNVTDVFADAFNSARQKTDSANSNKYDKPAIDSSARENQTDNTNEIEAPEAPKPENQKENQPVDDVEKNDEQPESEEGKVENTDNKDQKPEENVDNKESSDNKEDTPLDSLAGQPDAIKNQQQALEAMAFLETDTNKEIFISEEDLDFDAEMDTALKANQKEKEIKPELNQGKAKLDNGADKANIDLSADKNDKVSSVDSEKNKQQQNQTTVDITVDEESSEVLDTTVEDEFIDQKKQQEDTQQVKAESSINIVKEEAVVEVKTDEIRIEDNGKDKKIDFKDFKSENYNSQENMNQQSSDFSGMNDKEFNRSKNFDRGENISKVSFIASSDNDPKNIQQTLGLDKSSDKMDIDVSKNVDNIVKTVKTMVSNNNSTMVIRLDPPELGEMRINIRSGSEGMSIEIQAANAKAQQMIQQSSGQLRSALENSGVNVNNVDVQFKPDMKNDANAGSDFQDDQSNMFGQNNNENMADNGQNPEDSFQQNFSNWAESGDFEDNQFATNETIETGQNNNDQWQEISFDAVNVLV